MMLPLMLVSLVPGWMGWNDGMAVALQTLAWLVVAGLVLARYHVGMTCPSAACAGCSTAWPAAT
jgi:aerotaxis receptor